MAGRVQSRAPKEPSLADEFTLTPQPIRMTAGGKQFIQTALNVSRYDQADALLVVSSVEGTNGPSFTVRIITGMQMETEDGWVVAASFTASTAGNTSQKINVPGLLKYARWEVVLNAGTNPVITFSLGGMLRNN
jgi:hypothetical protein